jgi:hypothetical protein
MVEPQFARRAVELGHKPFREETKEGTCEARHDDAHFERLALGSL